MATTFSPQLTRNAATQRDGTRAVTEPVVAQAASAGSATKPDYASIYLSSILAMTAVFFVGVAAPGTYLLDSWQIGVGVGAMFAFWGGPAFGTMLGAARVAAWFEANEQEM